MFASMDRGTFGRSSFLLALAMAFISEPVPRVLAQKLHPAEEKGTARSLQNDVATSIEFYNLSSQPIKVYWLDLNGKRELRHTLKPRERKVQATFLTHPWLLTDEKDNALGLYYPDAEKRLVTYGAFGGSAGGFGGFAGGGRPGGFGGGVFIPATRRALIQDKSVQAELKLTTAQVDAVEVALAKLVAATQAISGLAISARTKKISELHKELDQVIGKELNPDQKKRFEQITLQEKGVTLFTDATLRRALNLTPEQQKKMTAVQNEHSQQLQAVARTHPVGTPEFTKQLAEIRRSIFDATKAFLTPEQKVVWQDLVGDTFGGYHRESPLGNIVGGGGKAPTPFGRASSSAFGSPRSRYSFNSWVVSGYFLPEKSVQEELQLNDEQRKKASAWTRGPGAPAVKEIMTPAQYQRYQGIYLQASMLTYGPAGCFRYQVVQDLVQLSEEQKSRILAIGKEDGQAYSALRSAVGVAPPEQIATLDKETSAKIDAVLTEPQRSELQKLLGTPFKGSIQYPLGSRAPSRSARPGSTTENPTVTPEGNSRGSEGKGRK